MGLMRRLWRALGIWEFGRGVELHVELWGALRL